MSRLLSAAAAAVLSLSASVALAADPGVLAGQWADPDGAAYTIVERDQQAVVTGAVLGSEPLEVRESVWGPDGLRFTVRVPSYNRLVTYKVLSADDSVMQTLWWTNDGRGGQETLRRVADTRADPTLLLGKWEDRSLKSTYWIQEVDGAPAVIGGVDARGVPKMVVERSVQGAVAIWTIKVPKTGYAMTYRCEPGRKDSELRCSWTSVSPEGERRTGEEVLRRLPE